MSRPEKTFEGELPRVLENVGYSDAKYEQCVLAERKYKSLYYGDVVARYEDPRPQIKEYTDISTMSDEEIADLNRELDAIEYSKTGKSRETNVRNCRYVICSKDWYIAIGNDGKVTTQILNKDNRAAEECKAKAELIIKRIKDGEKYDLIITNNIYDRGHCDGPNTLDHLKEIEGFNIPVIVLTISENERDTFVGYYGFDEYITKLLTQEKVKETFPKIINDLKFIKIEKQKSNKS